MLIYNVLVHWFVLFVPEMTKFLQMRFSGKLLQTILEQSLWNPFTFLSSVVYHFEEIVFFPLSPLLAFVIILFLLGRGLSVSRPYFFDFIGSCNEFCLEVQCELWISFIGINWDFLTFMGKPKFCYTKFNISLPWVFFPLLVFEPLLLSGLLQKVTGITWFILKYRDPFQNH